MGHLLDHSLPSGDIEKIKNIIGEYSQDVTLKENSIKTRQIGPSIDIDFTLQFPFETSICECHKICEEIEKQICELYPNCSISIHSEPVCYTKNCQNNCIKN